MAISATLLTSGTNTTDGSSFTTASISPAANSLLLVFAVNAVTGGADATLSGLSGTWTRPVNQAASSSTKLSVHWAQLGGSPGSGTLTITTNVATGSIVWAVVQVTGHNTTTPIVQTPAAPGASSTAASLTYAAAGAAGNRLFYGCGVAGSVTQTPRTNWSELQDQTVATPSCSLETQWRSDATETTGSSTLSVANLWATAGVEVAVAPTSVPGLAEAALSFTATAAGVRTVAGSAGASLAFGATLAGTRIVTSQAAAALTFTATGAGLRIVIGAVASSLPFAATAAGVVESGSSEVLGSAAATLAFAASAAGVRIVFGHASAPLSFVATAAGVGSTPGGLVTRPDTGSTGRPASGTTGRPNVGITARATLTIVRPNAGTTARP